MTEPQKYIVEQVLPQDECTKASQIVVVLSPIGSYTSGEWEPQVGQVLTLDKESE